PEARLEPLGLERLRQKSIPHGAPRLVDRLTPRLQERALFSPDPPHRCGRIQLLRDRVRAPFRPPAQEAFGPHVEHEHVHCEAHRETEGENFGGARHGARSSGKSALDERAAKSSHPASSSSVPPRGLFGSAALTAAPMTATDASTARAWRSRTK